MSWEGLDLFEEETAHEGLRYGDYVYLDALVIKMRLSLKIFK